MSDQEVTFKIGASSDGVEQALNDVKQLLNNAAEAAKSLNSMLGGKLSDSLKQASSSAQVLGGSLASAFNPLQIINFTQGIVGAAKALSTLISDLFIYTQAEKDAYGQEVSVNSQILGMVEHTKQLRRERQLLEAPDQKAQNALRMQFLIEDQQGTSKTFADSMKAKMQELQDARTKIVTVGLGDAATGMQTEMQVLFSETQEGQEKIKRLNDEIGLLNAKMNEAAAAERLLDKQNQDALAGEAIQPHLADQINGLRQVQVITVSAQKDRIHAVQETNQEEVADYQQTFATINASAQQFNNQQLTILMSGINHNSAQIIQASQQQFKKLEADEAASLERRRKTFDHYFQSISGAFTTFINGMMSGNETLGQAWAKMVNDMASRFLSGLERQLLGFVEHKLMEVTIHASAEAAKEEASKAAHAKEDARTAIGAAKIAFKQALDLGPVIGPIMAPIAAAAAFAGVMAFGSAEGGQYIVPSEQLTMLHRNEMVLPAGVADRMRGVIESGGGRGVTVVVNHSVNAVDAESFQSHIRRHAHVIGNEVARVLRKRRLAD